VLSLAFLFATVGRAVVDAALYHGADVVDATRQIHIEALDNTACHTESCALNAVVSLLRQGPLDAAALLIDQVPVLVEIEQPNTPLHSSHDFAHARPRAPPRDHA
jgi:hypothetical protein